MPAEERTEKATSKRRDDERKKGNVPKSQDLIAISALIASFYALQSFGSIIIENLQKAVFVFFEMGATLKYLATDNIFQIAAQAMITIGTCIAPMLAVSIFVAVALTMLQTKLLVSKEAFKFKASKMNPINGLKKMFSLRGLVELVKSAVKLSVVMYIVYSQYVQYIPRFARLMDMDLLAAVSLIGEFVMSLINSAAAIFLIIAVADYLYQRYEYEKSIRMTKQEIKEEYKHTEGDPKVKGAIRQRQRKAAMQRMMQEVPKADVIVRNPTHYAIALKYDADKGRAPMVIAKGADLIALRIIAIADQHSIATVENRTLARGLFEAVDINREIPEQFYQPVAEVLAFVYSLQKGNKKTKGKE